MKGSKGGTLEVVAESGLRKRISTLANRICPHGTVTSVRRLTGGASQQSWVISVEGREGIEKFVLRHAPEGLADRGFVAGFAGEAAAIATASRAGVPVPQIRYILLPSDDLGEGFLCSFVEGETIPRKIQRDDLFSTVRPLLSAQLGDLAAKIHALPTRELPLRTYRLVERLEHLRGLVNDDPIARPVFEYALRWLEENLPKEPAEERLVHGDFRLGNMMVGPEGIRAVLDWEQTHLGDPTEDLAFLMLPPWRFGSMAKEVGGIGTKHEMLAAYTTRIGSPVSADRLVWWSVFSSLRWGNGCSRMVARYRSGGDPSIERAMIARRASESEFDILDTIMQAEKIDV